MQENVEENNEVKKDSRQKKSWLRRLLKVFFYIILSIIGLNVILYILLSIPAVQQKVVDFAISRIKPRINTEISIDRVQIGLLNRINLQGIYIESQEGDTLLYAKDLHVNFNFWALFNSRIQINTVNLDGALVNISKKTPGSPFNFEFIIDAFTDTTRQEPSSGGGFQIIIDDIEITNSRINYNVFSEPETPGIFNPSHIAVSNLNTRLKLPSVDMLKLHAEIESLSLEEASGLTVNNIEAKVRSKGTLIWADKFNVLLPRSSLDLDSLNYNFFNGEFLINGRATLSPADLYVFVPGIKHLRNDVDLTTSISGRLPAININSLTLNYGEDLKLQADASISDYGNYTESNLHLNIHQFKITPDGIKQFAQIADSSFTAPDILNTLGRIRLTGTAGGQLNNLRISAEAWVNQGSIELTSDISIRDTTFRNYSVDASLRTMNFNLAPIVGAGTGLGRVSAHSDIRVNSTNNNLSARINGVINRLQYDSLTFRDIRVRANYSPQRMDAAIQADLPMGSLSARADMTRARNPVINFAADVYRLKTDYFYKNPSWKNPELSLILAGNLKGNSIDNIEGTVTIDSLKFSGDNFNYEPGKLTLKSSAEEGNRFIALKTSILDARIDGQYQLSTLPGEFSNMMSVYLPALFGENKKIREYNNNLNISLDIHNTENLGKILDLPADIIQPVILKGKINTIDREIKVDADIPHIRFGEKDIKASKINIFNDSLGLRLNMVTRLVQQPGDFVLNMVNIIRSDTLNTVFSFKNENPNLDISGELKAAAHFRLSEEEGLSSYLQFSPSNMNIRTLDLSFLPARIENTKGRTTISNFGFMVGKDHVYSRYFAIEGAVSGQKQDTLNVYFTNADLTDVLRPFDINNISATANGDIRMTNLLNTPELYTRNFQLRDIVVFNDTLGTLNIDSRWNNSDNAIGLRVSLANKDVESKIHGLIFTNENRLDLKIDLEKFPIKWLQPFMADVIDRVDGSISSRISVKGSMDSPKADGWLGFNNTYIGVGFTNVTYHIADTIKVIPDKAGFRDLVIRDNNNNEATASALVDYSELVDPKFLLNLDLNNFMVLNTEDRTDSLFFGRLMASGNVKIRGNMDDIRIDMDIRNERNSAINITIPDVSDASDFQSVVFINVPKQDSGEVFTPVAEKPLPIRLNMDLTVNPDINLAVIMNSSNPLNIQMRGRGLIKFSYDMEADNMRAYGSYTINSGSVRIRPQNLKTLEFIIQDGSRLDLVGDPMNTNFNLTAHYRVNTSLSTLDTGLSPSRIPVNCVLGIRGNMNRMDLTYDIFLPNASDEIRQRVNAIINTDEERIRQFGNLILFGSFYSRTGDTNSGNMLGAIASNTLSGGLNALFGSLLGNNWQIGTNIDTSDGSFSDADVSVNASTRLFNDRLTFSTNLGYRSDRTTDTNNEFIGDFDVEYQLTNTIRLKAYSRTNDRFYRQAATTQGIGIVYTKEAKTIKELFRFFRRKKNSDAEQETK